MALKPKSYEKFEDGNYEVNRIEIFTKDNSGNPNFVTQEGKSGVRLVARYRTFFGEESGPPGSLEPHEIALFLHAFGGDPSILPKDDDLKALIVLEKEVANLDKTVNVSVRNGWVQNVSGMRVPEGEYLVKFQSFKTTGDGGKPEWKEGAFGTFAIAVFLVQKNASGSKSPMAGCPIDVWLNKNTLSFIRSMAPSVIEAMLGTEKEELARLAEFYKETDHLIFVNVAVPNNAKNAKPDQSSMLAILEGTSVPSSVIETDTEDLEGDFLKPLYDVIVAQTEEEFDGKAFTPSGGLSDTGKKWAKKYLAPICIKNKMTKKFKEMTEANVATILESLGITVEDGDDW